MSGPSRCSRPTSVLVLTGSGLLGRAVRDTTAGTGEGQPVVSDPCVVVSTHVAQITVCVPSTLKHSGPVWASRGRRNRPSFRPDIVQDEEEVGGYHRGTSSRSLG